MDVSTDPRTREAYQRLAQAHAGLGDEARAAEFSSKADADLAD